MFLQKKIIVTAILLRGRGTNLSLELVIEQDVGGFDVPVDDPRMACTRSIIIRNSE